MPLPLGEVSAKQTERARTLSSVLQLATGSGFQVSEDEAVEVAVHHGIDVAGLVVGAVILDHGIGHEDIAADLVAPSDLILDALDVLDLVHVLLLCDLIQLRFQHFHRVVTVLELAALGLALVLAGCSGLPTLPGLGGDSKPQSISRPAVESGELQFTHPAAGDTIAVFDTSAGVFKAVLFPSEAPQAYDNFAGLVQSGYYNGLTVSRVEKDFLVEAGQGADGKGTTIWNGSRCPIEVSDKLHHYSGALCMATDTSGQCASVFYVMDTLPGSDSVTQELVDQMNAASYRAEVVSAYQTAGGAPYLDYTDTVLGQVYEGMDVVDAIGQAAVDENQKPTEAITINSVSIETYQ